MSDLFEALLRSHPDIMVWAAGGVVVRRSNHGVKILVVHRPRYGDWSLPKGKLEEGERLESAALREVLEETGYSCSLGEVLPVVVYVDGRARTKAVVYWVMTVESGSFSSNDEVDQVRWVGPERVMQLLDYERDIDLLRDCLPRILESV